MRPILIFAAGLLALIVCFAGLMVLTTDRPPTPIPDDTAKTLKLTDADWTDLPGWDRARLVPALGALRRSCARLLRGDPAAPMGGSPLYGTKGDWALVCSDIANLADPSEAALRDFFQRRFVPRKVLHAPGSDGLYTGYYEPAMDGSLTPDDVYQTPLLSRPDDLVMVQLGDFRDHLKGERIAGRIIDGRLKPYEARAEIEAGALDEIADPIAFVRDPVDAFFLHIQGSGRVILKEGGVLRVGYAGQNGHPYTSIGRVLIRQNKLESGRVTMQAIRQWLAENESEADEIMNANASYVFFKDLKIDDPELGPIGAEGVPLTPYHSLAVDRSYHAMGVPMWVDTLMPLTSEPLQNLMIAQDTGGAIRGPVRGDVFFGFENDAPLLAGGMKRTGDLYVLLPKALAVKSLSDDGRN